MIKKLLQDHVQRFIRDHENDDLAQLILQSHKYPEIPVKEAVAQIQSRKKAKSKIPFWHATENVVFPPTLSLEQCSSEITARYKAELLSGKQAADITGGMGVDTFYMSQSFESIDYVEKQDHLAQLAKHNFRALGANNINSYEHTAIEHLKERDKNYDLIFVDPARRDQNSNRVFRLSDCEPNIESLMPTLRARARIVMIKVSPLLDISVVVDHLDGLFEVHVVSVRNEVKELLLISEYGKDTDDPLIKCVNYLSNGSKEQFQFRKTEELSSTAQLGEVEQYIYEPNASILKGGAFKSISTYFGLLKLHSNTHLYTSNSIVKGFPGRVFQVKEKLRTNKKLIKKSLPAMKANITLRNYPMTVQQLRRKTGIAEGGGAYIFGLMDTSGVGLYLCDKLD